jgi:hypothetical protein
MRHSPLENNATWKQYLKMFVGVDDEEAFCNVTQAKWKCKSVNGLILVY